MWVRDKTNHGGKHWDVQYPNGGYDNVYEDGYVRPGKGGRGNFSPIEVTVDSNDVMALTTIAVGAFVIYEGIKWGVAVVTALPIGGVSLGLASITP